ncbi:MAG TPA: hypothetical protein VL240_04655 [Candidatus Binatia bacterium]|nr:hypothetical protein [Candidatus Binatia bacterium]
MLMFGFTFVKCAPVRIRLAGPFCSCMARRYRASHRSTCQSRAALASDPETNSHNPPCFRSPNGALEDSFYLATGRQLWDASFIYVPTLVLASERDFWSRPADREKIAHDLVHASVRVVVIPDATHFVHLDRPERGRNELLDEIVRFLKQ